MKNILFALNIAGYVSSVIVIVSTVYVIVLWCRGITPVLYRLGKGLATTKIALFAGGDEQRSLKNLLVDSGVFREKNIISVDKPGDIGRAEKGTLYVMHWPSWKDNLDATLIKKKDTTGLVVYAPYSEEDELIPDQTMARLDECRNVTVTQFRGRLLSDILLSMMTRSCAQ